MLAIAVIATGCGGGSAQANRNMPGNSFQPSGQTPPPQAPPNGTSPPPPAPPAGGGNAPPGATLTTYKTNLSAASDWVANNSTLPDGAILYTPREIVPYYGNIAALGMTKDPSKIGPVRAWMQWYVNHLNSSDIWGLGATIYDYSVSGTTETSTNNADSTDSYAGTFLSLAWRFYQTGNADAQWYVKSIAAELDSIGQVLARTQQSDGLTWSKPDYQIKFLMDNCEGYRGLRDLASLFQALGDAGRASLYNGYADHMLQGIQSMWLGNAYAVYKDVNGNLATPNWSTWYADAVSQLYPILEQVIPFSDPKAQQVWATFNQNWAGWPNLSFNRVDPFPWVLVSKAAAAMGDSAKVNQYIVNVQNLYVEKKFPWPWYSMEAGWFMQVNGYMAGEGF